MILQLFVHSVKIQPREAAVRVLRHPVLNLSHYILVGLWLHSGLCTTSLLRDEVLTFDQRKADEFFFLVQSSLNEEFSCNFGVDDEEETGWPVGSEAKP